MKIAAVFPPYTHKIFAENLKVVDNYFGKFQPLNLLYAAAYMKKAGHDVIVVDANAERLSPDSCLKRLREFSPDILCFNLSTYMFHDTLKWIRIMKEATGLPVLVGGINLRLYPEETMSHTEIDYAVTDEADPALPLLLEAIGGGASPEGIPGVAYREGGEVRITRAAAAKLDFDKFPFPARELIDNSLYYEHISQRRNFTIALAATGCPYNCRFCAVPEKAYSLRSVENVVGEIDECHKRYGIREIDYFDAVFTTNRNWIMRFCEEVSAGGYGVEWSCRARADNLNAEMTASMSRAGCKRIYIGIESGREEILNNVNKKLTIGKVMEAIRLCRESSIRPLGFFMIGNPGETRETAMNTIRFARSLGLDYAQFSRTIAKPFSQLDKELTERNGRNYWKEYILGAESEKRLPTPWTDMSEREIERLTRLAYLAFYFRPGYILKMLMKVKSLGELRRYAKVALMMLFHGSEAG